MSFNVGGVETYIRSVFRNIDKSIFHLDFINDQVRDDIAFQEEITNWSHQLLLLQNMAGL